MILCIGTTPAAQRVMVFQKLALDSVNRARQTLDGVAGKSVNVAKVLRALGERPVLTGFLGGERGEELRRILQAKGLEMDFMPVAAQTRQCITVIDESAGTQTELVEESLPVQRTDYEGLLCVVRRRVATARAVIMSGTLTPGGPPDFYAECVRLAAQTSALSVVDAQGLALTEALKAGPGLVKPNRSELAATVGRDLKHESELLAGIKTLYERGAQRVVITAGNEPTLAYDGKTFWRIRSPSIKVVNPIGSGDSFTAGLVSQLLRGDNLGEACRWASAAGAANALSLMPGELDPEEVTRLLPEVAVESVNGAGTR
jgi:tagatose 6-phosphate kinase